MSTPPTNQKSSQKESKIILSREDRTQKKAENVRSKGSNPQVRLTRAMLLRKNRALGIKPGKTKDIPSVKPFKSKNHDRIYLDAKVGDIFPMDVYILPQFGRKDHREDAPHFTNPNLKKGF